MQQANGNKVDTNVNDALDGGVDNIVSIVPTMLIKGKTLATRCEICHQSDLYDPIKNSCSRCKQIQKLLVVANRKTTVIANTTNVNNQNNTFSSTNNGDTDNNDDADDNDNNDNNNVVKVISFTLVSSQGTSHYIAQPVGFTLNPVQSFFAKIDKAVEERVSKISTPKKLLLAVILCLVGLSGAISTVLNSFKATFVGANNSMSDTSDKDEHSFHSNINTMINPVGKANGSNKASDRSKAGDNNKISAWQPVETLLASTVERRDKAFTSLGLKRGNYVLAAFSLTCDDCIRLAKELKETNSSASASVTPISTSTSNKSNYKPDYKVVGVAIASEQEIAAWKQQHHIDYPIKSISETMMDDLGIALFPTLINLVNGEIKGVSQEVVTVK